MTSIKSNGGVIMKKILLVAATILAVSAGSALAQGPYVGGNIGLGITHDSDLKFVGAPTVNLSYESGLAFDVAVGYKFNENLRAEGQFGYLSADFDKYKQGGESETAKGDLTGMSFMANAFYDVTQLSLPVVPFVGVGLGLINGESKPEGLSSKSDTVFGYQAIVGASWPANKNLNIDLSYRFQGAASDFEYNFDGVKTKASYMSSSILAGVRYNF